MSITDDRLHLRIAELEVQLAEARERIAWLEKDRDEQVAFANETLVETLAERDKARAAGAAAVLDKEIAEAALGGLDDYVSRVLESLGLLPSKYPTPAERMDALAMATMLFKTGREALVAVARELIESAGENDGRDETVLAVVDGEPFDRLKALVMAAGLDQREEAHHA